MEKKLVCWALLSHPQQLRSVLSFDTTCMVLIVTIYWGFWPKSPVVKKRTGKGRELWVHHGNWALWPCRKLQVKRLRWVFVTNCNTGVSWSRFNKLLVICQVFIKIITKVYNLFLCFKLMLPFTSGINGNFYLFWYFLLFTYKSQTWISQMFYHLEHCTAQFN